MSRKTPRAPRTKRRSRRPPRRPVPVKGRHPPAAEGARLAVGLRNPGPAYRGTRHNVGAEVVEELAEQLGVRLGRGPRRVDCRSAATVIDGTPAVLALPKTFMNVCGPAVQSAVRYYKIPASGLLVVHDDIDLDFGRLRLHEGRGPGGHNGVRSVIGALGTPGFWRLKVGVGRPPVYMEPADYVLGRFFTIERTEAALMVKDAAEVVRVFMTDPARAVSLAGGRRPGPL